jgi:hypothetical protein
MAARSGGNIFEIICIKFATQGCNMVALGVEIRVHAKMSELCGALSATVDELQQREAIDRGERESIIGKWISLCDPDDGLPGEVARKVVSSNWRAEGRFLA